VASQLGQLLRVSVKYGTALTPLCKEIEQLRLYVEIQELRYKERLVFEILPFDAALSHLRVLSMILQPCVENAITHGMRAGDAPLHITVRIAREENALLIHITDDGAGLTSESNDSPDLRRLSGSGIGIRNIQERIALYFGGDYGIRIDGGPEQGCRVLIRLPVLPEGESERG
jgi:two-component system sensor histidine kinase YesM